MELGSISADPGSPWVLNTLEEFPCSPLSCVQPKGCPGIHPGESILVFQPQAWNTQHPWHCLGVPPSQNPVFAFPMELEFRASQRMEHPGRMLSPVVSNRAGRNEEKWDEDKVEISSSATDWAKGV